MSVENLSDEIAEDAPEPASEVATPTGKYATPRILAIARGEDPDAIDSKENDPPADEPEAESPSSEVAEEPADAAPEPTSWVTEYDKQRALAYGLDPEDLAAYSSREEFGRVTRAIDKAASRREPTAAKTVETPAPQDEEIVDDTSPRDANGKLNLAYFEKNGYDEATIELVREQIANSEAREKHNQQLEAYRQEQEQAEAARYANEFHRAADELRPDFFGRVLDEHGLPVEPSAVEIDRRQKLWDAAHLIADHMILAQQRQGLPPSVPPMSKLLKQAEVLAFGDEIAAHEQAAQRAGKRASRTDELKRLAAQSQRRRPVAQTAGTHAAYRGAPASDPHSTESILQHPDVEAALRRINDKSR